MANRLDSQVLGIIKNWVTTRCGENSQIREEQLLEDYHPEIAQANVLSDTASVRPDIIAKEVIPVVFAKVVSLSLFNVFTMPGPSMQVPKLSHLKETTTAKVDELGRISLTKVQTENLPIAAEKYAYRTILSREILEDSQNKAYPANIDVLSTVITYDIKSIADELDTQLNTIMRFGAAAGDVWWKQDVPSGWAEDHPSLEYSETLYDAIVAAITNVAKQKYNADFMLMSLGDYGKVQKLGNFVPPPSNALQGQVGRLHNLDIFSSLNSTDGIFIVGQKKIFGWYGVYIPMQYLPGGSFGVYDTKYDAHSYVVRTRVAMRVLVGEALSRVIVYSDYTDEEVELVSRAGHTLHYPINPTETMEAVEVTGETTVPLTIVTWDSRTGNEPDISSQTKHLSVDLETGALKASDDVGATATIKITYSGGLAVNETSE